jgi:tetratricopeptide (TPR) repeat protein
MKKILFVLILGFILADTAKAQEETPPPPMNLQPAAAWSVFTENFRNQMYEFALPFGRWLVNHRPTTLEGFEEQYRGDRIFSRMITIYGHMAENTNDPTVRTAYVDSALVLYDRALTIFDDKQIDRFRWMFDRARFMQMNQNNIPEGRVRTMQEYMVLYEKDAQRFIELADGYYITYLVKELISHDSRDRAIEIMLHSEQLAGDAVRAEFNEIRDSIFRSPAERIEFLEGQLADDPDNIELKKELFTLYQRTGDIDKVNEIAVELYEAEPNLENTLRMADNAEGNAEYNRSIRFLQEALRLTTDSRKQAEINLRISDAHLNLRNLDTARDFARRAQRLAPSWGDPMLKIAEIYAQAVTDCSSQLDRLDKAVYWLVIDYLERAQRIDSAVASRANRSLSAFRGVTPTPEEKFYLGWDNGDTLRIDGSLKECYAWINETTTIR